LDSNFLVLLELLRSDGSIVVNKKLASNIGLNEAVLYSELLSKYVYFAKKNQLTDEGYFFNTVENLQKDTTLTKRQQLTVINNLVKFGLISTKLKGIPAKRHFKIITNFENIKKYSWFFH